MKARNALQLSRVIGLVVIVLVLISVGRFFISPQSAHADTSFAYRCGIHFCLDGHPFYFAGANTYDLFSYGDGTSTDTQDDIENKFMDKASIDQQMTNLESDNVTVLRLWMFSHEQVHGFEPALNVYSTAEFDEFDYIIQSAIAHNIKLIPVLENYWADYGGIDQVLQWESLPTGESNRWRFFNQSACPDCLTEYENYANYVLNHINHYSGVAYKDEPDIFSWELMNEPRYEDAGEDTTGITLRVWVDTVAGYIKSIDPNHMVDAGLEGQGSQYGYGGNGGNPFVYIQESPYIDFTSAHLYPNESWANLSLSQTEALIDQWISDAHNVVGKPFYLGEWNTFGVDRITWWQGILGEMEKDGGDGDTFWDYALNQDSGEYTVVHGAPELAVLSQHSLNMQAKNTSSTSISPSTTVVDNLNDFSDIYAHSANLAFDTGNTQYFNNDSSRLERTTTDAEWAIWNLAGMTHFQADTYFWPYQTVSDFQFFASADNSTYTQITPQIYNLGGNWTETRYALNLPTGTNYVKIVFPTDASNSWDPQISQVSYLN